MGLSRAEFESQSLLHRVDPVAVEGLLNTCPVREIAAEAVLIEPAGGCGVMYLLLAGRLRVHLESPDSDPVALLEAGQSVGELSLIDRKPRSAWVIAAETSRVLEIGKEVFWSLIRASHEVAINLLAILSERLRGNNSAVRASQHLQQEYQRYATLDALTGMYNRRWLSETMPRQVQRCVQDGKPVSLLMVDIDHFKKFNDTHGHAAGDFVLHTVAQRLKENVRPTDLVARYGGEEFTVVLPQADTATALQVAERLRGAIAAEQLVTADGKGLGTVTVSIGIATLPGAAETAVQALLERADQALYRAKNAGRNRCEID